MPPVPFLHPQNALKSLAAVANAPQTPLGELTALPRPQLRGLLLREAGRGMGVEKGEIL